MDKQILSENEISAIVKTAMVEVVGNYRPIECPVADDVAKEMGHFFGMIKDVGDGDLGRGIESVREGVKFINKLQATRQKIADWISRSVIVTAIAAVLALLGLGIKVALGK